MKPARRHFCIVFSHSSPRGLHLYILKTNETRKQRNRGCRRLPEWGSPGMGGRFTLVVPSNAVEDVCMSQEGQRRGSERQGEPCAALLSTASGSSGTTLQACSFCWAPCLPLLNASLLSPKCSCTPPSTRSSHKSQGSGGLHVWSVLLALAAPRGCGIGGGTWHAVHNSLHLGYWQHPHSLLFVQLLPHSLRRPPQPLALSCLGCLLGC